MRFLSTNPLVNNTQALAAFDSLRPYIKKLQEIAQHGGYGVEEGFINVPFDETLLNTVVSLKEKMAGDGLKYIILVGIGGSSLGAKAVYDALFGHYDVLQPARTPKLFFVESIDFKLLRLLTDFLADKDPREVLVNIISKSGETIETSTNAQHLLSRLPKLKDRIVITTSQKSTGSIPTLEIPQKVGGRFSVFTAVGLFPLLCANINVVSLLEGAMEIRRLALDEDPKRNTVAMSAIATFLNSRNGKDITNTFLFGPRLESLGKWNIQLIAETLGKEGKGITPTVSIGSNDLHTTYQLYMDGPKDKFFTFVNTQKQDGGVADAVYKAVKGSFAENGLPFVELLLDDITEKELGAFMQFKMMEVLYLAKLMGVSPFGQPEVEKYKKAVG